MTRFVWVMCLLATVAAGLPAAAQFSVIGAQNNVLCNGSCTGSAAVSASGGVPPYSYSWSPSGGNASIATGLCAGIYAVTVTDNLGTSVTREFTITEPPALVVNRVSQTNIACFGGSNGAASVSVSGGTPGYTYDWTPGNPVGDGTPNVSGLTAGVYTVTVTDANLCTSSASFEIEQPASFVSGNATVTNVSCFGGSNGAINLTPSGGTAPYTFQWTGGVTTEDRTGLAAGTYNVTITDANGCETSQSFTVTQPPAPLSGTTVVTNVACFGSSNGAINLTPTGGTAPYTFDWGDGVTTEDRTGLPAGNYGVTITDANGCTATVTATVNQPPSPVSGSTVVTNLACFGGSNGAINLTPTGGTGPYVYDWGNGITTEDRTGLPAGTYTVTIMDANGCTGTVTATVTQPAAPVSASASVTSVSCSGGSNGAINLTPTGGTAPYTFDWGLGITTEDRTGLTPGSYTVTITDANGCQGVESFTVGEPAPLSATTVVTNVACFGGSSGAINLTPIGGTAPYTYDWGSGVTTEDRTGLPAGNYSVTITDANGCTTTTSATVNEPFTPLSATTVVTNLSCFGDSNGAINLTPSGGIAPYTFDWGSGITTEDRTGLTAGDYTVLITDANGCTTTAMATVTQPSSPVSGTTIVTDLSCFGGSNGAIDLTPTGGTGPYTFDWGGGITTEDRTGLAAGDYTVLITDATGCIGSVTATVTQPAAPLAGSAVTTDVSCFGGTNGAIDLTPTGGTAPYTFDWGSGITTEDRSGLAAGTYTVTITDANGCTTAVETTITEPAASLSGSSVATDVSCFGGATGAIDLTPAGGTAPYTFDWGGGITTEDRSGLAAGDYSVLITDANGCSTTVTTTINEPSAPLSGTTVVTDASCLAGSTGAIDLTPTGGTAPYTFDWGSGITTEDRTDLMAGTYTVTITDANGCTATMTAAVEDPVGLTTTGSQTDASCAGATDGTATVAVAGGTAPYTYLWSPSGGTAATATNLSAGDYTVMVTDANGCSITHTYTITAPAPLVANGSATAVSAVGSCDGTATVAPSGGTAPYSIVWSEGGQTTGTISGLCATTVTATITDANGCTVTWSGAIESPEADLAVSISGPAGPIAPGGTVVYTIAAETTAGAPDTTVSGAIPAGTTFEGLVAPDGWSCTLPAVGGTGTWSCSIPLLPASSTATFTLTIGVPMTYASGSVVTTVEVSADVTDPIVTNNTATTETAILAAAAMANVPTLDPRAIAILVAILAAAAILRMRA